MEQFNNNEYTNFSISTITALPRFGKELHQEKEESKKMQGITSPISSKLAIYINIPFCRTICRFCMLRKAAKQVNKIPDSFIDSLLSEFHLYADELKGIKINTIYFGGGTPSMLNEKQFEKILFELSNLFSLNENVEISFEGEAASLNRSEFLKCLKSNNVSRISFGLQTLNEKMRFFLGRTDSLEDIYSLKSKLDLINFDEINVDYIYNLPNTDIKFIEKDLFALKDFNPTSIDCHPLKYVSCSKHLINEIYEKQMSIPSAALRIEMFNYLRNWCLSNGYKEQLVDQYTKEDCRKTNLYIRQLNGLDGGEYIGFGPGARSHYGNWSFINTKSIHEYSTILEKNEKPLVRVTYAPLSENYITRFPKRNDKLFLSDLNKVENAPFFKTILTKLTENEYLLHSNNYYQLTEKGLNWYQNLQEELLSEDQKAKHLEGINIKKKKFERFGNYFKNVGTIL